MTRGSWSQIIYNNLWLFRFKLYEPQGDTLYIVFCGIHTWQATPYTQLCSVVYLHGRRHLIHCVLWYTYMTGGTLYIVFCGINTCRVTLNTLCSVVYIHGRRHLIHCVLWYTYMTGGTLYIVCCGINTWRATLHTLCSVEQIYNSNQ